jgi:hypothetical protein
MGALAAALAVLFLGTAAPAPAQEPFVIPDTTHAACVFFNFPTKKYVGAAVGDKFTITTQSLYRDGVATCDASGSWILTWHNNTAQRGCLIYGGQPPGHNWFEPSTGAAYSPASSVKCRTDGRWQLVKGWR